MQRFSQALLLAIFGHVVFVEPSAEYYNNLPKLQRNFEMEKTNTNTLEKLNLQLDGLVQMDESKTKIKEMLDRFNSSPLLTEETDIFGTMYETAMLQCDNGLVEGSGIELNRLQFLDDPHFAEQKIFDRFLGYLENQFAMKGKP